MKGKMRFSTAKLIQINPWLMALIALVGCSTTSTNEMVEKPKWVIVRPMEFKHLPLIKDVNLDSNGCGEVVYQKPQSSSEGSYFMRMYCTSDKEIRQPSSDAYLEFLPTSLLPFQEKQIQTWREQAMQDSHKKNVAIILCFRGKVDREPCSSGGANITRIRTLTPNKNTYTSWNF